MHAVAVEHATPKSSLRCVVGLRVVWMDHTVPFHRSASVTSVFDVLNQFPTAVQAVAELHATDVSDVPRLPVGLSVVRIDHAVPFHRSARLSGWLDAVFIYEPTAMHDLAAVQATLTSSLLFAPAGFGVGWTDQAVPFQRSS